MRQHAQQQPERIRYQKVEYSGPMSEYHTEKESFRNKSLTPQQKAIYERIVFGISAIDKRELSRMSAQEIQDIKLQHKKCQDDLNIWKQQIVNRISNQIFKRYFPKSPFTKTLTEKYPDVVDPSYTNPIPFKLLGIKRADIIKRLLKSGILPKDFYKQSQVKTLKTN
jgi:hypothetical protein